MNLEKEGKKVSEEWSKKLVAWGLKLGVWVEFFWGGWVFGVGGGAGGFTVGGGCWCLLCGVVIFVVEGGGVVGGSL